MDVDELQEEILHPILQVELVAELFDEIEGLVGGQVARLLHETRKPRERRD